MLNPARPTCQLVGTSRRELIGPLARTLQSLGVRRALVVAGEVPGAGVLDEFSTLGPNQIAEFLQPCGFNESVWSTSNLPLQPATLADLAGGDATTNAGLIRRLLHGEDRGPKRDAVLLNASAALFIAGQVGSMADGWELASRTIDSGRAAQKLSALSSKTGN